MRPYLSLAWPPASVPDSVAGMGRVSGKATTSRMVWRLVRCISQRSMETPKPAVGGMPLQMVPDPCIAAQHTGGSILHGDSR